jgi:hypothetical protein
MAGECRDGGPSLNDHPVTLSTHLGPQLSAEAETEVARFGRYIVERRLASAKHAPYWLMWVRAFLNQSIEAGSIKDAALQFVKGMVRMGHPEWRVAQAERSVECFCGPWRESSSDVASARLALGEDGKVAADDAVAALRALARLRHYSPRTEEAYVDWVVRFFRHLDGVDAESPAESPLDRLAKSGRGTGAGTGRLQGS